MIKNVLKIYVFVFCAFSGALLKAVPDIVPARLEVSDIKPSLCEKC